MRGTMRKLALLWSTLIVFLIVMAFCSRVSLGEQLSACLPSCNGVVDKAPGGVFTVEIAFKNTGSTEGTWSVNVVFEGEKWTWMGTSQNLTLKSDSMRTLTWNGFVPINASIDSVARLIVYYDDSYKSLNWWIHVVPGAELSITSSTVK